MARTKVSITFGIPTYNVSVDILDLTIQSVINSSVLLGLRESPILICFNGCPNKQALKLSNKYKNVKAIHTPKYQKGKALAINTISSKTNTEFLVVTDDDVVLDERSLALLLKNMQDPNIYLTFPKRQLIYEEGLSTFHRLLWKIFNVQYYSDLYKDGDTFFTGMCFCVKNKLLPTLPVDLVNDDQFLQIYFRNNCKFVKNAIISYRGVYTIRDYKNRFFRINYGRHQIKQYFDDEALINYQKLYKRVINYKKAFQLPVGDLVCFLIYRIIYNIIRIMFNFSLKRNLVWERALQRVN